MPDGLQRPPGAHTRAPTARERGTLAAPTRSGSASTDPAAEHSQRCAVAARHARIVA
jgi:hypothetical protein